MSPRRPSPSSQHPHRSSGPPADHQIDEWRHLVWYVVNRVKPRLPVSVSDDELYAAGLFGLMNAARSYDTDRGAGFKTYAYHRIRGAILDELRRLDYLPRSLRDRAREEGEDAPVVLPIPTDEDGHENLAASRAESLAEDRDLHEALNRAIAGLPERMRVVMVLYYKEGLKMREIGDVLALTESRVSQIHSSAVGRLRRAMRPALGD